MFKEILEQLRKGLDINSICDEMIEKDADIDVAELKEAKKKAVKAYDLEVSEKKEAEKAKKEAEAKELAKKEMEKMLEEMKTDGTFEKFAGKA